MTIIERGQELHLGPREVARQVRPLIGLNRRQAQANVRYREKVYQRGLEAGLSHSVARERSEAAAIRYAGKQHRTRAETIVLTENAFAYNRGAHLAVSQSIAHGLMTRCELVWTTAGTNRVCSRCLALKGSVVGHTDEVGVTLPPLHPRCRCAIAYREARFNFDIQRFGEKFPVNIDGIGEGHIPIEKLTKYALNPDKAPDKALAFEKALGYNLGNATELLQNIASNINNFEMVEVEGNNYGRRFKAILELKGENGKVAKVLTAWLLDKDSKEFRLTSLYVDKK